MFKKTKYLQIAALLFIGMASCSAPAEREANPLVGKWLIQQVFDDSLGLEVTDQLDPEDDRYILIREDGSFYSDGRPYGRKGGEWLLEEDTLYLEIDPVNVGDDSFWVVDLQGDSMTWKGWHSPVTERYRMTLKRNKR